MTDDDGIAWRTTLEMLAVLGFVVTTEDRVGGPEVAILSSLEADDPVEKTIGHGESEPVGGI